MTVSELVLCNMELLNESRRRKGKQKNINKSLFILHRGRPLLCDPKIVTTSTCSKSLI